VIERAILSLAIERLKQSLKRINKTILETLTGASEPERAEPGLVPRTLGTRK
jgi:hypothetical protein